ncbi:MAG: ATP-binding cassette domain-containing protein [Elusimicrobiota bacterium]|nr:ATP-binding cassette domain-containing protein [Elusimicrobiota bacterium]
MIEVKHIYKKFNNNIVLDDISFVVPDGDTFTIIGGSGQGKSVIIKHLFGFLQPDKGEVIIDGKNLKQISKYELFEIQTNFGIVFQGGALFDSLSIRDNVGFGLKWIKNLSQEQIDKIVIETLRMVDLSPKICNLKPVELSGGMKKRVAVARAIAYKPKYLLYDEPTTGLDPLTADLINNLILHLQKELKITSIVVTHDMKTAYKISDNIVMLQNGKFIESGSPHDLKNTKNELVKKFIDYGNIY